ncbi:DUF5702 domain-containing protein [Helicovermis profundi]|uniref:Uncharacterized protein n=1 Tax=Helicovermis profundi TaxID=3065157 RepID=A0AAU9E2D6_9FIRM|nr:hypothetical protein HLPR_08090 [Clostridia bacterium S502]
MNKIKIVNKFKNFRKLNSIGNKGAISIFLLVVFISIIFMFSAYSIVLNLRKMRNSVYRNEIIISNSLFADYDETLFNDYGLTAYRRDNLEKNLSFGMTYLNKRFKFYVTPLEDLANSRKFLEQANEFTLSSIGLEAIKKIDSKINVLANLKKLNSYISRKTKIDKSILKYYNKIYDLNNEYKDLFLYFNDSRNDGKIVPIDIRKSLNKYRNELFRQKKVKYDIYKNLDYLKKEVNNKNLSKEFTIPFIKTIINEKNKLNPNLIIKSINKSNNNVDVFNYVDNLNKNIDENGYFTYDSNYFALSVIEKKSVISKSLWKTILDGLIKKESFDINENNLEEANNYIQYESVLSKEISTKLLESFIFDEYIMGVFFDNVNSKKREYSFTRRENEKLYSKGEIEFIIYGKSFEINRISCNTEIYLLRIISNTIFLITNPKMKENVDMISLGIAGLTDLPYQITKPIVIASWSAIESKIDLNSILKGDGIAVYKTQIGQWKSVLINDNNINKVVLTKNEQNEKKSYSINFYYDDYLRFFLKQLDVNKKIERSKMIIITNYNIKNHHNSTFSDFIIKHRISSNIKNIDSFEGEY